MTFWRFDVKTSPVAKVLPDPERSVEPQAGLVFNRSTSPSRGDRAASMAAVNPGPDRRRIGSYGVKPVVTAVTMGFFVGAAAPMN